MHRVIFHHQWQHLLLSLNVAIFSIYCTIRRNDCPIVSRCESSPLMRRQVCAVETESSLTVWPTDGAGTVQSTDGWTDVCSALIWEMIPSIYMLIDNLAGMSNGHILARCHQRSGSWCQPVNTARPAKLVFTPLLAQRWSLTWSKWGVH